MLAKLLWLAFHIPPYCFASISCTRYRYCPNFRTSFPNNCAFAMNAWNKRTTLRQKYPHACKIITTHNIIKRIPFVYTISDIIKRGIRYILEHIEIFGTSWTKRPLELFVWQLTVVDKHYWIDLCQLYITHPDHAMFYIYSEDLPTYS